MRRINSLILLGIAVFLGLMAAIAANYLVTSPNTPKGSTAGVVVARTALKAGDPLTPEKLMVIAWPAASLPTGTSSSIGQLTNGDQRVALQPIEINEPVLLSKLSGPGGHAGLASALDPAKRAATIRIDDVAGVAGFARPGDLVDVMVTRKIDDSHQITDVLLQNIRIIALDQQPQQQGNDAPALSKTATLEVTQFQAQQLALGQSAGSLSLALRNFADQGGEQPRTARLSDLRFGGGAELPRSQAPAAAAPIKAAAKAVARPSGMGIEVVRGVVASNYHVGAYAGY
jgi:pilus assembly protein CpaB